MGADFNGFIKFIVKNVKMILLKSLKNSNYTLCFFQDVPMVIDDGFLKSDSKNFGFSHSISDITYRKVDKTVAISLEKRLNYKFMNL